MYILGISAYYHDSAACLLKDGQILAAAQEERFSRKKHDPSFPLKAVEYCLSFAGIEIHQVDQIAFYDKPLLKFERLLESYYKWAPRGLLSFIQKLPSWLKEKMFIKKSIRKNLKQLDPERRSPKKIPIFFPEHHLSHAASAFFPSPFTEAAYLTIDGVGEYSTTSFGIGKQNSITQLGSIPFPHSLGLLYSAFTYYLGFKVNSGEYKLMGLAPYGDPKYKDRILQNLLLLQSDGSFALDMSYFAYESGMRMINPKFEKLFAMPRRKPESAISQKHMDLAASIQSALEEAILALVKVVREKTNQEKLVLAGGVALNCVANGKIIDSGLFEEIWIQPAAGDAGGALGAALCCHYLGGNERTPDGKESMQSALLGPAFSDSEIAECLTKEKLNFSRLETPKLLAQVCECLDNGMVVGWFQGRMEFGPRALGNRSILADPRNGDMQKNLNLKIKFRESFRPFAPVMLESAVKKYFPLKQSSPYMLIVQKLREAFRLPKSEDLSGIERLSEKLSPFPAITHVDYSSRIQTTNEHSNPLLAQLLETFNAKTGCPILVNTSFNVRGEPIVCNPKEAIDCFLSTKMDILVLGNHLLTKADQNQLPKRKSKTSAKFD